MRSIGTAVIVRDDQAGVLFGEYEYHQGREVCLVNSRKIWSWSGDKRLSVEDVAVVVDANNQLSRIVPGRNSTHTVCQIVDCSPEVAEYYRTAPASLENQ